MRKNSVKHLSYLLAAVLLSATSASQAVTYTMRIALPGAAPAVAPTFSLSPTSMAFGIVPVNSQSAPQSFTLTNTGPVALNVGAITLPSGAALTSDSCSNRSIAAGASCSGSVAITPTQVGSYSGTVSIASNSASTNKITLTGSGAQNDAWLSPTYVANTGERNVAWLNTGYSWIWNVSGYSGSAAPGDVHFETLISNNTGANISIYLHVSVDNLIDGFKISGVSQSLGCLATGGFTTTCTMGPYSIPPGKTRIDLSANNAGGTANPAGMSAWVTDSGGAVLTSTSNSTQFYWTTATF